MKNLSYWKLNLIVISALLSIWFIVSLGFGVLLSESIDHIRLGGFKLGFWFGQQGSLLFFLLIIFFYCIIMNKLDERFKK
jgi:putative solute:sodium symporter small subunit